jgi:hypothetical protein
MSTVTEENEDTNMKVNNEEAVAAPNETMEVEGAEDQPAVALRDPTTRPVYKLSVKLIDTYKYINKVVIFYNNVPSLPIIPHSL